MLFFASELLVEAEARQFPLAVGGDVDVLWGDGEVGLLENVVDEHDCLEEGVEVELQLQLRVQEIGHFSAANQLPHAPLHSLRHKRQDVFVLSERLDHCQHAGVSYPGQAVGLFLGHANAFLFFRLFEVFFFDEEDGGEGVGLCLVAAVEFPGLG